MKIMPSASNKRVILPDFCPARHRVTRCLDWSSTLNFGRPRGGTTCRPEQSTVDRSPTSSAATYDTARAERALSGALPLQTHISGTCKAQKFQTRVALRKPVVLSTALKVKAFCLRCIIAPWAPVTWAGHYLQVVRCSDCLYVPLEWSMKTFHLRRAHRRGPGALCNRSLLQRLRVIYATSLADVRSPSEIVSE